MKRNKRQQNFTRISSTHKFIRSLKEYTSILALLIPIIPSVLYAGIVSYQYGHCYFYNISLQSYLGLSHANIVVQSILIICIGIGVLSLNALGYICHIKSGIIAIIFTVLTPIFLCFFTIVIAEISDFEIIFIMFFFFVFLTLFSFVPGIIFAFPDKKSSRKKDKNMLYDLWNKNKLFQRILLVSPALVVAFTLAFSVGYASCFNIPSLYFTTINQDEYAIVYEGNDYYQLAATLSSKKSPKIQVLLDMQMRIKKDNLLIYLKDSDSFYLTHSNE